MRGMRTKLLTLALMAFGLATLTTSSFAQTTYHLMHLTNQVWAYNQTDDLTGTGWEQPLYDDSAWPRGNSVLAVETAAAVVAQRHTILTLGRITYYFRASFTIPDGVDPATLVLNSSNFLDDGIIVHLNGQEAWRWNMPDGPATYATEAIDANPRGDGTYFGITWTNAQTFLQPGLNHIAVEVHQDAPGSSDITWGTHLFATVAFAPIITQHPIASTNVLQGRSFTLSAAANAQPPASFQWYKDGVALVDDGRITGATSPNLTVNNMTDLDAGTYHAEATNPFGTAATSTSSVSYTADTFAPVLQFALVDVNNPARLILQFDESVQGYDDSFMYFVDFEPGGTTAAGVMGFEVNANTNQVILLLDTALDPAQRYVVTINNGGTLMDNFNNQFVSGTFPILFPKAFQQGVNGYAGTQDAEVHSNAGADTPLGAATSMTVDNDDAGVAHGLIRFDDVFGPSSDQIPTNATVHQAFLRLHTQDQGATITVRNMLADWDQATVTWNTLVNGLDTEVSPEIGRFNGAPTGEFDDIDVTASVREYLDKTIRGEEFYGWGLISTGTDGWDSETSENGSVANRPSLIIVYTAPVTPCSITQQPVGTTVEEGGTFTLNVETTGTDLQFQWHRNNVEITGAIGSSYTVSNAAPSLHSGLYHVVARNSLGACTSDGAQVTVQGDVERDNVVSAVGQEDQTSIVVTFDDAMNPATAENPANYTVVGLGAATAATLSADRLSVTLTTPARTVGNNYTLQVSGVTDDSEAGNLVNPANIALVQRVRVFAFMDTWKYEESGTDLGTTWKETSYDDSAWPSGPGMFGYEVSATATNAYEAMGVRINTLWNTNNNKITFYARKQVAWPYNVSGTTFTLNHFTDDGMVMYVNGTEGTRFNMTNSQPILNTDQAVNAPGEGVLRSTNVTGVACGQNLFAVEVHQNGATSSDIVFGGELIAVVPSFDLNCPVGLRVDIVNNGDGTVTITRTGGTLVESDSVTGTYTDSPNQANPLTIPASAAAKFYQARE